MNFLFALLASIFVSAVSLVGIFTLILKEKILEKVNILLVGFASGTLIGGAFLHLIPEVLEKQDEKLVFLKVIFGFLIFFILEKYLFWRHCHQKGECDIHVFTYLNLFGDGLHNFIDGLILGVSFFINIKLGWITTLAIILHEIPQELGDFGVLLYGGLKKIKALFFNFLCALTAVLGTFLGFFFAEHIEFFSNFLISFAAGGFIYIASCDLIPNLHREKDINISNFSIIFFILGLALMFFLKLAHH